MCWNVQISDVRPKANKTVKVYGAIEGGKDEHVWVSGLTSNRVAPLEWGIGLLSLNA